MRGTLLLVGMVLAAGMAQAKTCTWIGGNGDWFAEAGWEGGLMPETGDDVVLAGTTGATLNLQGRETVPLASLAFGDATGGDWALTNGTLRIADNGAVFTNSRRVTMKISAVIAGAGDLVKCGDGTLALSGANTFTGRLVIEGGRLQPETDAALGPVPAAYRAEESEVKMPEKQIFAFMARLGRHGSLAGNIAADDEYDNSLICECEEVTVGVPGQNFIYTHLNRVINEHDLDMIYLSGPGHGGNAMVAQDYLDGSYTDVYPNITRDEAGMQRLFKQFSFPGGIPSHVAPETPGSIHEGGELGYSLAHAFGAVMDNPDLIAACVVGDGEAETGPLATAWHGNKFVNPITDGAVLPILHLNGFKIANPTLFSRI